MSLPYDANWTTATARGNQGGGLRLGLLEGDPQGRHRVLMERWHKLIVPQAALVVGDARLGAGEVCRLAQEGCAVIAMPFILDAGDPGGYWDAAFRWAADNGVLLFGGTDNGSPATGFPATHPDVIACAACNAATGDLDPNGSSRSGKLDLGVMVGTDGSSGATVVSACIGVQWLAAGGVYLFSRGRSRLYGFSHWLVDSGTPLPGGRGYVPYCGSL